MVARVTIMVEIRIKSKGCNISPYVNEGIIMIAKIKHVCKN